MLQSGKLQSIVKVELVAGSMQGRWFFCQARFHFVAGELSAVIRADTVSTHKFSECGEWCSKLCIYSLMYILGLIQKR